MNLRSSQRLLGMALALALTSCASAGYVPATSMPAARAALQPEYRLFYDALQDYGDWVLIEPFGFVFRPRVDFATFRPYEDGFWAPSDPWGWVWISAEPFGWATYHYGTWTWDRFQGWVWLPGLDWAPAWVDWQIADAYAGWSPIYPRGGGGGPGGDYLFAPLSRLGSTDLRGQMATRAQLGDAVASARPLREELVENGVRFNPGPPIQSVERARGQALTRVRIDGPGAPGAEAEIDAIKQAATTAARKADALMEQGGAPPRELPLPRPDMTRVKESRPAPAKPVKRPAQGRAAADTTR